MGKYFPIVFSPQSVTPIINSWHMWNFCMVYIYFFIFSFVGVAGGVLDSGISGTLLVIYLLGYVFVHLSGF